MILALTGSSVDGPLYRDVVDLAHHSPGPLDGIVTVWSAYGAAVFALLMVVGWWQARKTGPVAGITALAVPVAVLVAFGTDAGLKLLVREQRPCHSLPFSTLERCPGPGDWSFPSNHTALALFFVSRRLGVVASVCAVAMAASRVWVGVHYPHDVLAGALVGGLVAFLVMTALRRWPRGLAGRLARTRLRPLLVS